MKWLKRKITSLYDKKVDATGLAVFRMLYSLVLFCEVAQIYYFRHLIFDEIPFIDEAEIDVTFPLILWMIVLVLIFFGLFTRTAAILNYVLGLVFVGTIQTYEYHMFYAYMGLNFLILFCPVSQVLSVDRLLLKLKYSGTRVLYVPERKVSIISYYAIILLGIAFVYFDSIFYKASSHNWTSGIGMWLPASLPQATRMDASILLNNKWLALALGYLTFAFEVAFIFLFWFKAWRWPLFVIGVGLHLGILIVFPLPWFGLGVIAIYMLLVPLRFWKRLFGVFKFREPRLIFFYDEECPLCVRTKIILSHFDVLDAISFKGVQTHGFNNPVFKDFSKDELLDNICSVSRDGKIRQGIDSYLHAFRYIPIAVHIGWVSRLPGLYHFLRFVYRKIAGDRIVERCRDNNCGYNVPPISLPLDKVKITRSLTIKDINIGLIMVTLCFFCLLQLNITYNSDVFGILKDKTGIRKSSVEAIAQKVMKPTRAFSKIFFGITEHAVFMDSHFNGYNHLIAVEAIDKKGKKYWLPIISKNGQPGWYAYGFSWVKWTFRVNAPAIDQEKLVLGVRDYSAFWAYKNGLKPDELTFRIYVKKVDIPKEWTNDHLDDQLKREWREAGQMYWSDGSFVSNVPSIEGM